MLARLARRLSRERGWGAHLAALEWRQRTLLGGEIAGLRQAAVLSTASAAGGSGGATGKRRGGSRGKGGPKGRPPAAAGAEGAQLPPKPSHPASTQQLETLLGRFKVHARGNDAARAEHFFRSYIQAGGAPLHWMLPMLLGTYGRLRQADKAWAIYRQLVPDLHQAQQQQGRAPGGNACDAAGGAVGPSAEGALRSAAAGVSAREATSGGTAIGAPAAALAAEEDAEPGTASAPELHAWEGRLAARQQQLEQTAAQLVRELRLDALPLDEYGYGALLTALSRAEHPPYDLPAHYANKAAQAFEEMQAAGVKPNVVLWHNLLDCQAKACQPDAAFATYRRMLAAGAPPNSWTFSMLISACGRARQPGRAADVVERLMPQAGVAPSLTVWNSLLGAYGRAGSVDAAYAAWLRMLESGTTPDDCTERSLALAFGSHPALAAEVVAEARQVRQQREAQGAAEAVAAAEAAQEQGSGGGGGEEEAGTSGSSGSDGSGKRPPYRLHQHRQTALAVDQTDHISRRSQRRNPALGLLMSRGLPGAVGAGGAAAASAGGGGGESAAAAGSGEEVEGQGLQLRQLLLLDLHGSSQAAARMVLLRRLEALVMHAPELFAEMDRLEQEHYREQERQQQLSQARRQKKEASRALMHELRGGGGAGGSGSRGSGTAEAASAGQHGEAHQQQQQQQEQLEWPAFGQRWDGMPGSPSSAAEQAAAAESGAARAEQRQGQQQQQQAEARPWRPRFLPPPLNIITGIGRHSKGGGVLKAAVKQVLQQQGLPTRDDPSNEGVVIVPWHALVSYLERQREAMDQDHFFTAARVRYLYVLSGVAGLAAAANLLPRLAPWLPS